MKKVLKIILGILVVPYVLMVIVLTIFLLNYNDYRLTELGDKTLLIVRDDELEGFKKGELVVIPRSENKDINPGDDIFFYEVYGPEFSIRLGRVESKQDDDQQMTTLRMPGEYDLLSSNVIGRVDDSTTYSGIGGVLSFLQSRWGFLFIVILPVLVAFIWGIYSFVKEIKVDVKAEQIKVNKV